MAAQSAQKRLSPAPEIPDKLYFRIGDVARICGVEPYVLRFWETQFPSLKPNKGGTGQRLYRRREVELALRIRELVHGEGYTLAGAKQALDGPPKPRGKQKEALAAVKVLSDQAQLGAQPGHSQSDQAQVRLDSAAAVIGQVRAELRELARQLAAEQPTVARRKPRLATFKVSSDPLFPV